LSLARRWKPEAYKTSIYFYKAINKYGWDSFDHQIVAEGIRTQEELDNLERVWILCLKSNDSTFGYNLQFGGIGGKHSQESCRKMSESHKRRGTKPPSALGIKRSPEIKVKMKEAAKGRVVPWEVSSAGGKTNKGKPKSAEHRAKISAARIAYFAKKKLEG
jgi:group I intron endonuclease